MDAGWFLRPEQIIVPYASRFYPSEVVKMSERVDYFLGDVQGRCYVLQTKDYIRGRPLSWKEGQAIYVCEQRYNESYKSVTKIKNWPACLPPELKHDNVALNPYPYPLVLKKLPSASMLNRAGKQDASEHVSRNNTPQSSAYTAESEAESEESEVSEESEEASPSPSPSVSPEATPKMKPKAAPKKVVPKKTTPKTSPKSTPTPKTTKINKRKSSQIQPEALAAQPTKAAKIVKKAKSSEQEALEPEESAPVRQPSSVTFHCVYPYPGTKTTCSEYVSKAVCAPILEAILTNGEYLLTILHVKFSLTIENSQATRSSIDMSLKCTPLMRQDSARQLRCRPTGSVFRKFLQDSRSSPALLLHPLQYRQRHLLS